MVKRASALLGALTAIVMTVGSLVLPTFASEPVSDVIDSAVRLKTEQTDEQSLQAFADKELEKGIGGDAEWYAMILSQYYDVELGEYAGALEDYVLKNEIPSAVTREKFALALACAGSDSSYITDTLSDSVGEQGIMSYVFGLHILNNGFEASGITAQSVAKEILSMQLDDGGWAVMGQFGDSDVTAMTLQALAPLCDDGDVSAACDKALEFLGSAQLESGGYMSMGAENCESTAQVLCALCSLGIDCESDERFIKNGKTVMDALMGYRLKDGSFCHLAGEGMNETATYEVVYALVSYERMKNGNTPFYVFDSCQEAPAPKPASGGTLTADSTASSAPDSSRDSAPDKGTGYKPIAIGAATAAALVLCAVLTVLGKRSIKNYVFIAVVTAAVCLSIGFTDIKTEKQYYADTSSSCEKVTGEVTMSIRCDTVAGETLSAPEDGIILKDTRFDLHKGDTAYDLLVAAAKKNGIRLDTKGGASVYVSGINGLYEFDFGELSGWVYHVNDISASVGSSAYELKDGDRVEWLYTRNIERDLSDRQE